MADNTGIAFSSPDEGVQYPDIARELVYHYVKNELEDLGRPGTFGHDEVFVVWFTKTLQNWKALVSTTLPDGRYYEVTYNGDKKEAYFDVYYKNKNIPIPEEDIARMVLQMKDGYHSEKTLDRVANALVQDSDLGFSQADVKAVISVLLNEGILFRERY